MPVTGTGMTILGDSCYRETQPISLNGTAVGVSRLRHLPQCPIGTGPPSLTLRNVNASGTAASEISMSTQKASM